MTSPLPIEFAWSLLSFGSISEIELLPHENTEDTYAEPKHEMFVVTIINAMTRTIVISERSPFRTHLYKHFPNNKVIGTTF
jgi:hypothetical protein